MSREPDDNYGYVDDKRPRAACSPELLAKARPNPRDVEFEAIAEGNFDRQEFENPDRWSVRYAWRHYKGANKLMLTAIKYWFHVLPCRLWFHKPEKGNSRVCQRCGAWRG